jgi:hypothetical protein
MLRAVGGLMLARIAPGFLMGVAAVSGLVGLVAGGPEVALAVAVKAFVIGLGGYTVAVVALCLLGDR